MTSKDQVLIEPSRITSDFTVVTVEGGYAIKISPDFSFSWETADETDDITSLDAKEIFVTDKNQPVYLTTTKGNTIKHSDPKVIQHILSELRYEYSIDYFDNRTSVMWEVPMDFPSLNLLSVYSDHEGNFKQLINEWSVDTIEEKLAYDQYFNSHTYNLDFFNVSEISDDYSIRFMPAFTTYPDVIENDFIHFQLHLPVTKYLINLLQEDDEVNLKKAWDNGQNKLESIGNWVSLLTGSNIDPPEEWHDVVTVQRIPEQYTAANTLNQSPLFQYGEKTLTGFCSGLSSEQRILFLKGYVLCEKHFNWQEGSCPATCYLLNLVINHNDYGDDYYIRSLYNWIFKNRGENPYSPTGCSKHGKHSCNSYEDMVRINLRTRYNMEPSRDRIRARRERKSYIKKLRHTLRALEKDQYQDKIREEIERFDFLSDYKKVELIKEGYLDFPITLLPEKTIDLFIETVSFRNGFQKRRFLDSLPKRTNKELTRRIRIGLDH